jgi:PAS domain S-box-containing protein
MITAVSIFAAETFVMFLLPVLPPLSFYVNVLLDSSLLTILVFPPLYVFLFRPMVLFVARDKQAQEKLRKAHDELEVRVAERTAALTATNKALQHDITERKRAKAALLESETRFRTLFENSPNAIFITDPESFAILDCNSKASLMNGYERDELIGQSINLLHTPEIATMLEESVSHKKQMESLRSGGMTVEGIHHRKDGSLFPIESSMCLIMLGGREVVIGIDRDISERKRAEEAVRQSQQNYENLVGSIDGIVWEADATTFQFTFVSQQAERLLGYPIERWLTEPTFWKDHIYSDDREWAVALCVSATADKRHHDFEYRMITADGRIVWLRDIVSVIVENDLPVKLRGVMVDVTERKQRDVELRLLAQTTACAQDCISVTDMEDRIIFVNEAFLRTYGYSEEELLGKNISMVRSLLTPSDVAAQILPATLAGGWNGEIINRRKDATDFPIELWTSVVHDEQGKTVGMVGVARDITERKRAEEEIRRLARYPAENPFPVLQLSQDGTVLYANEASQELLRNWGCTVGSHVPNFLRDLVSEAPTSQSRRTIDIMLAEHTYSFVIAPVLDAGYVNLYGLDITERKRAEDALWQAEQKYRSIFENAVEGIYQTTPQGQFITVNPSFASSFGYESPEEMIATLNDLDHQFYVDRDRRKRFTHLLDTQGALRAFESQAYRKDGSIVWISENARTIHDDSGRILHYEGTTVDITERKRAETQLEQSLSMLRATLESTADGILVVDAQGKIQSFNQKFIDLWRIPDSVMATRDDDQAIAFVLNQLKDPDAFVKKIRELYSRNDPESYDTLEFKDGRTFERYSKPQRIGNETAGRVWSFRDVTERKRAQESIQRLLHAVEQSDEVIFMTDPQGIITYVNPAFERVYGWNLSTSLKRDGS